MEQKAGQLYVEIVTKPRQARFDRFVPEPGSK